MSLTAARGPLGPHPAGRFSQPVPTGLVFVEPHPRRVVARKNGVTVIDTEDVVLIHRSRQALAYGFRARDVGDLPHEPAPDAAGFVCVAWDAVDAWFEEGRELVHYPPNPYHRVDCRPTQRRLTVTVGGATLVDTDDTIILFETSLAPKLYVAPQHVRTDLLVPSDTQTYCNYKGYTVYWNAVIDGTVYPDVAWTYDDPLPESQLIKGCFSFEPAHADVSAALPAEVALPDTV